MHYRPEIDGLRALAVLAVVAHHAGAPISGGFLGVDIFFVISGYLITTILLREMGDDRFSLGAFYARRARRILPALVVVVAVSLPFAWELMTPEQMKLFGQGLVALSVFGTNGLYWWKSGYFAPDAAENPLIHTWSLAVEEQFYVVFPLALLWLWRRDRVLIGLWVAVIAGLLMAEIAARLAPAAAFYHLPFRAWELLAGAFAATCVARYGLPAAGVDEGRRPHRLWAWLIRWRDAAALIGLCWIGISLAVFHDRMPIPGFWMLVPVGGSVLVILCAGPGTWAHWVLSARPAVALGLISYSIYLWHQPVFAFARIGQLDQPGSVEMAGLTLLVVCLAWATWAFVEKPFRRHQSLRPLVAMTGVAVALALTIGITLHIGDGLGPIRYGPQKMAVFETAKPSPVRKTCHGHPGTIPPKSACVLAGDTPAWAVLGDSHGVEIAFALAEKLSVNEHQRGVVQLTASGCPPALGFATEVPGCSDWTEGAAAWLEARPGMPVLLVYRHSSYLFGKNEGLYPSLPDAPRRIEGPGNAEAKRDRYWASFRQLVARLRIGGRRVVVLAPVPEIARPIGRYLRLGDVAETGDLVTIPLAYHSARSAWVADRMGDLGVEILDPALKICDGAVCYGVRGGQALYFDDDHLSLAGAARVIEGLDTALRPVQTVKAGR